jgi:hypothetical protein
MMLGTLLRHGGHDANSESSAAIWRQLATSAPMEEVLAFYRAELAGAGWETGGGSSTLSTLHERQTCAWHRSDLIVRLSFWNMEQFAERYPNEGTYSTVYDLSLIDHGSTYNEDDCTRGLLEYLPSPSSPFSTAR